MIEPFTVRPRLTNKEVSSVYLPDRLYLKTGLSLILFLISGAGTLSLWSLKSDPMVVPEYLFFAAMILITTFSAIGVIRLAFLRLMMPLTCRGLVREAEKRGNVRVTDEGVEFRRDSLPVKVAWSALKTHKITGDAVLLVTQEGDYIILPSQELVDHRAYSEVCKRLSRIHREEDSSSLI